MSDLACKQEIPSPVMTLAVLDSGDSCPRKNRDTVSSPKDEVSMICTEPIHMKIIAETTRKNDVPIGRITKHKDFDVIGGKKAFYCVCAKRNGLQDRCERVSCQDNNPGCKMTPPKCWPQFKPKSTEKQEIIGPVRLCFLVDKNSAK